MSAPDEAPAGTRPNRPLRADGLYEMKRRSWRWSSVVLTPIATQALQVLTVLCFVIALMSVIAVVAALS